MTDEQPGSRGPGQRLAVHRLHRAPAVTPRLRRWRGRHLLEGCTRRGADGWPGHARGRRAARPWASRNCPPVVSKTTPLHSGNRRPISSGRVELSAMSSPAGSRISAIPNKLVGKHGHQVGEGASPAGDMPWPDESQTTSTLDEALEAAVVPRAPTTAVTTASGVVGDRSVRRPVHRELPMPISTASRAKPSCNPSSSSRSK